MKPYPFVALNHFTVPTAILIAPSIARPLLARLGVG
jgi:uncharacterized membrane protein